MDLVARLASGALAEQRDRLGLRQRRHGVLDLPVDAQQLTRRHKETELWARARHSRQLGRRVDHLLAIEYKGKKVAGYLDDDELSELLYEDGLAFATEYPVDEDDLADRFKKASTIIEVIQRRKAEEDRKKTS